ncbi:MAG: aminoacyl-tRNA hydrolase [Clostridia bacterium]|nr:aminoacyl-tRNA hydrolase [Clostridia bacterium]
MIVIVGLGNPGAKYKNTYHNVGFMIADSLAKKLKVKFTKTECDAKTLKANYKGTDFVIAKPETFMNLSGNAVKQLVKKYDCDVSNELMICYDDVDLPVGNTRLRAEGSAGSHNGMRNIVAELNTTEFKRLRVGIKNEKIKNKEIELIDLVLSKVDYEDKENLEKGIDKASDALIRFIEGVDIQRISETVNKN